MDAALLLLADGRLPTGGHAHSWGLEEAAARGRVHDVASMAAYARGKLHTTGLCDAALAAAAVRAAAEGSDPGAWALLDAEAEARCPSPVLRRVSRSLGRQLLRTGRGVWPHEVFGALEAAAPSGPHQPLAFGAVACAAGAGPAEVALASAHLAVAGLCAAAVRLLALDPYAVHRAAAGLAPDVEAVAAAAAAHATARWPDLPCPSAPAADLAAERHATWEMRLFAS